jgi:uncharacterized membrane protein
MWASLIALVVFAAFLFYLGYAFLIDVIQLIVNGFIIYVVGLRTFVELRRANKEVWYIYIFSAIIALAIVSLTGSFIPLIWAFTLFLVFTFLIKHGVMLAKKRSKKFRKFLAHFS